MTLHQFKTKAGLKNQALAWMFKVERHTITRWLNDDEQMPLWLKTYLNWLG